MFLSPNFFNIDDSSIFLSADIETCLVDFKGNKEHVPIMIGLKGAFLLKSWSIYKTNTDNYLLHKSSTLMMEQFFMFLMNLPYKKINVYFHNLSSFDGFFLLDYLPFKNRDVIFRDQKIYQIQYNTFFGLLFMKDSYLILPLSLKKASSIFNLAYNKLNYDVRWNSLTFFQNSVLFFNCLNYFEYDLFSLYELIWRYIFFIKNLFSMDISASLTLPSFTQKLFLENYFVNNFETLSSNQDNFIRSSYLGAVVDVYKPQGTNVVMLDVNSLYPYIMAENKFGLGRPKFIKKVTNLKQFCLTYKSFIKVKVFCKKSLKYPLIALKKENKNIQPTGSFITTVYSEEILYCLKYYPEFYDFTFISAVFFESSDYIFKDYINFLYDKRLNFKASKNEGAEFIIKLMLNSLYGRFGIKLESNKSKILNEDNVDSFLNNCDTIKFFRELKNDQYWIQYEDTKKDISSHLRIFKSRIDWASAITSLSRIFMQNLKEKVDVLYTDTDSIVIFEKDLVKLKNYLHPTKLGKLKILGYYNSAIFLSPKTYVLEKNNKFIFKINGIHRSNINLTDQEILYIFNKVLNNDYTFEFSEKTKYTFWKNFKNLKIIEKEIIKTYALTYNKRLKIFNKSNLWIDTMPLIINL